jgi:hypothetical protein
MLQHGDIIRLVISIVVFGVCIFVFCRRRNLATVLLLLGSLAYAAKQVFSDFMLFIMPYRMRNQSSRFLHVFYPTDASAPWTGTVDALLFYSGIVLVPLGLILYLAAAMQRRGTLRHSHDH